MARQEQSETWQEIKEIWGKSSRGEKIYFQFSKLIDELKNNMSQWEKDAVESDMVKVKSAWKKYKSKVSQWEKDSIKSDVAKIKSSWEQYKGNVSQWEKDAVNKGLSKLSKLIKKFLKKLKGKK